MIHNSFILKSLTLAAIVGLASPQLRIANCCCTSHQSASESSCCKLTDATADATEQKSCCCSEKEEPKAASKACCQVVRITSKGCNCSCKSRTFEQTTLQERRVSEQALLCDSRDTTLTESIATERLGFHKVPIVFKPPARILYGVWRN